MNSQSVDVVVMRVVTNKTWLIELWGVWISFFTSIYTYIGLTSWLTPFLSLTKYRLFRTLHQFCSTGYYEFVFVHTKYTDRLNITPRFYLTLILRPFINFCWQSIDWNINSIEIKPCTAVYFDPWMMPIQISAHRGSFIYSSKIYVSPDLGFNATCDAFIIRSSCNLIESFLLHLE